MRFRTFLLVIVLLIVLPGAGLTSAQNSTITLWTILDLSNTNEPRSVLLKGFIEEFTQANGIVVEVEQVAWNQISTRLAVAVQEGGDVPDLVETGSRTWWKLAASRCHHCSAQGRLPRWMICSVARGGSAA